MINIDEQETVELSIKRFEEKFPIETLKKTKIFVIGAGALGSKLVSILQNLAIGTIVVIDGDVVETVNRVGMYREEDIGKAKVNALGDIIEQFKMMPYQKFIGINKYFEDVDLKKLAKKAGGLPNVWVLCVDSHEVRRMCIDMIYDQHTSEQLNRTFLEDVRASALWGENSLFLMSDPQRYTYYLKSLYGYTVPLPCNWRMTPFNAMTISGIACAGIASVIRNEAKNFPMHVFLDSERMTFDRSTIMAEP